MTIYFKESQYGHFCLIENDLISNFINQHGFWEGHLRYLYSQFIKSNFTIIDGGANIGFHTVQFAKLANEGRVYSFEPQPFIFNVLSTNCLLNGASDVIRQSRLGLGDELSSFKMTPLKDQVFSPNCVNYGGRGLTNSDVGEEDVQVITIDSLLLTKLDFMKFDVQGFELKTLVGGRDTISKNKPIIFIENSADVESDKLVIDMLKEEFGYVIYRLHIGNKEDCVVLDPVKHIEETKFIESQTQIKLEKI